MAPAAWFSYCSDGAGKLPMNWRHGLQILAMLVAFGCCAVVMVPPIADVPPDEWELGVAFTVFAAVGVARLATVVAVFVVDRRRLWQARAREAKWRAAVQEAAERQAREWRAEPHRRQRA